MSPGDSNRHPVDAASMAFDQDPKRGLVAVTRLCDGCNVVERHLRS
jgi:hypothetical protein